MCGSDTTNNRHSLLRGAAALALIALVAGLWAGRVQAQSGDIRLLAFGDSLTHGYGLPMASTFPAQLEASLRDRGFAVQVINGGNSGDTTAAGLARLDWALADDPDAVILALGANDALRGLDPAEARANLDNILQRLGEQGLPVLLAGMRAPRNLGPEYWQSFDAIFPDLAEKHNIPLYPFFLDGVALNPQLNQADGIHPNEKGVAEIVARILPDVVLLLERTRVQRGAQDG